VLVRGEWAHATSTQNIENLSYVVPGFSIAAAAVGAQIGALTPADFSILGGLLTTGAPPAGATPQQIAAFFNDRQRRANRTCQLYLQGMPHQHLRHAPLNWRRLESPASPSCRTREWILRPGRLSPRTSFRRLYAKSITALHRTARDTASSESVSPFL